MCLLAPHKISQCSGTVIRKVPTGPLLSQTHCLYMLRHLLEHALRVFIVIYVSFLSPRNLFHCWIGFVVTFQAARNGTVVLVVGFPSAIKRTREMVYFFQWALPHLMLLFKIEALTKGAAGPLQYGWLQAQESVVLPCVVPLLGVQSALSKS